MRIAFLKADRRNAHSHPGVWPDARIESCAQRKTQGSFATSVSDVGWRLHFSLQPEEADR